MNKKCELNAVGLVLCSLICVFLLSSVKLTLLPIDIWYCFQGMDTTVLLKTVFTTTTTQTTSTHDNQQESSKRKGNSNFTSFQFISKDLKLINPVIC